MALAEILRARADALRRTARAACGELGTVTLEALPLRELEGLLRQPDASRAVFYAACRELQRAGEELRKAGQLYTPDGVLQMVSDSEAEQAARTVLALSGWTDASGQSREASSGEVDGSAVQTEAGHSDEIRLSSVQNSGKDLRGIRPEFVQARDGEPTENSENRFPSVQNEFPGSAMNGQDSRETEGEKRENPEAPELDKKTQAMALFSSRGTQNVVAGFFEAGNSPQDTEGKTGAMHETESEVSGKLHESRSEISEVRQENLHEITSEFLHKTESGLHETVSEFGNSLHEIESEFTGSLHENESESRALLHENKSDSIDRLHEARSECTQKLHETESESAERMARQLLEGLRRAKWVRGG